MTVEVFFDYTCGFSHRAQHWLDAVSAADVVWRPFSLLEQNRNDEVAVFDQPELADNVSLIALAVHEAVRATDGDLDGYRRRMFSAWHDETGRLSTDDVVGFGREAGLGEFDREAAFAALTADHAAGQTLGVFGTPTFVFGSGQVAFVKLDAVPAQDRADPLFDRVRQLATGEPSLREWQRVSAPGAS